MTSVDFTARRELPPLTHVQIEGRFPEPPDGWTAEDDVALMEGLFMGLGFEDIAVKRGGKGATYRARFFALRRAAVGDGVLTLDAQKALLAIVRGRVK